jgi:hypothetical protein
MIVEVEAYTYRRYLVTMPDRQPSLVIRVRAKLSGWSPDLLFVAIFKDRDGVWKRVPGKTPGKGTWAAYESAPAELIED